MSNDVSLINQSTVQIYTFVLLTEYKSIIYLIILGQELSANPLGLSRRAPGQGKAFQFHAVEKLEI